MRIAILAAAAAAWAGCAGAQAAADTPAKLINRPRDDRITALWPTEASRQGVEGSAMVSCAVTTLGATTDCKVISENPPNMGFGAAVLQLTPLLVFSPAMHDGHPVPSRASWGVAFRGQTFNMTEPGKTSPGDIVYEARTGLPWLKAPTSAQVAAAFPPKAKGAESSGHVVLRCKVSEQGALKGCAKLSEFPVGVGFADAAKSLTPLFQVDVPRTGVPASKILLDLAVQLIDPATEAWSARGITKPMWLQTVNPKAAEAFFPPAAAQAGVRTGRGLAGCTVSETGQLTACADVGGDPEGFGFGAAAAKVASNFVMNRWTGDGLPVDGQQVVLPVRLEAPDTAPAMKH